MGLQVLESLYLYASSTRGLRKTGERKRTVPATKNFAPEAAFLSFIFSDLII